MAAPVGFEAQRLIALSLGKISASRGQRGGINLHKNLLVASVLYKARTVYMMENVQHMLAAKRAEQESNAVSTREQEEETPAKQDSNVVAQNDVQPPCHEASAESRSVVKQTTPKVRESLDKENTPPSGNVPPHKVECTRDNEPCEPKTDNNTNSDNGSSNVLRDTRSDLSRVAGGNNNNCDSDYVSQVTCASYVLKRRRSMDTERHPIVAKKPKYYENGDSTTTQEQMQTETTQISNLVSIFNTGFNGLCSADQDSKNNVHLNFSRSDSHSGILCSSQVEQRVDMVPVIALTV
ncbi:immediate early response gene 5-like protein [Gigantopelta aegis]|uniref:immediate early response gene 5-like protein n=1 Tax=Gigantopelta aegis TaxID=1735272 RepID=UPI001B88B21A|nr:immediate early response gene 5-like protein [Gigantopelta aegis]